MIQIQKRNKLYNPVLCSECKGCGKYISTLWIRDPVLFFHERIKKCNSCKGIGWTRWCAQQIVKRGSVRLLPPPEKIGDEK